MMAEEGVSGVVHIEDVPESDLSSLMPKLPIVILLGPTTGPLGKLRTPTASYSTYIPCILPSTPDCLSTTRGAPFQSTISLEFSDDCPSHHSRT